LTKANKVDTFYPYLWLKGIQVDKKYPSRKKEEQQKYRDFGMFTRQ